jgi:hypothetical protein
MSSNPKDSQDLERLIVNVGGGRVILDKDLAKVYGVTATQLNQAVKPLAAKLNALEKEVTSRLHSQEKAIVELMQQFFSIINPPPEEKYPDGDKREIEIHVREEGGRYRVTPGRKR